MSRMTVTVSGTYCRFPRSRHDFPFMRMRLGVEYVRPGIAGRRGLFAIASVAIFCLMGCGSEKVKDADLVAKNSGPSFDAKADEPDLAKSLRAGMTKSEVREAIGATHLSIMPVIDLGSEVVRYRSKMYPEKILQAEFRVTKTGANLKSWKLGELEAFDNFIPLTD